MKAVSSSVGSCRVMLRGVQPEVRKGAIVKVGGIRKLVDLVFKFPSGKKRVMVSYKL